MWWKIPLKMNVQQPDESISQLIIWWNCVPYLSESSKGEFKATVVGSENEEIYKIRQAIAE